MGCKWSRASDDIRVDDEGRITAGQIRPGHSDAARRISDTYNLHKTAGTPVGHWMSFSLADGRSDNTAYPDKASAVRHAHHNEYRMGFIQLQPCSMSICEAESVLRWQRQAAELRTADRDDRRGGLDVIPRLRQEDHARQMAALAGYGSLPVALGHRK